MSFINTLASKLGFNQEDPAKPKTGFYPTPTGAPIQSPFISTLTKNLPTPKTTVPFTATKIPVTPQEESRRANSTAGILLNTISGTIQKLAAIPGSLVQHPIDTVGGIGRSIARELVSTGQKKDTFYTPKEGWQQFVLGQDKIGSFTEEAGLPTKELASQSEQAFNLKPGTISDNSFFKKGVLPFMATAQIVGDLFTGGESKGLKILAEDTIKSKVLSQTEKHLRDANLSEPIIKKYAQQLTNNTDPVVAKTLIKDAFAEHSQNLVNKANSELKILDEKQKVEPLTAEEYGKQKFLSENKNKPEILNAAYAAERPILETGNNVGRVENKTLYNGSNKIVTTEQKTFDNVLEYPKDQQSLVRDLAEQGNKEAKALIQKYGDTKIQYNEADQIIKDHYLKEGYDAVKYNNEQLPTKGIEYHDLNNGKFYNEDKNVAELYANQNRNIKYNEETKALDTARGTEPVSINRNPTTNTVDSISEPSGVKIYDNTVKELSDAELKFGDAGPANPEKIKKYGVLREKVSSIWDKIVENLQNNTNRIDKIVKDKRAIVSESSNPSLSRVLYSGRLQSKVEAVNKQITSVIQKTVKEAKSLGIKYADMKQDINDYLHALHTPERNAVLGDGAAGMTNVEAEALMESLKAKPYYSKIKEISNELLDINRQTLDVLYAEGRSEGVIDKELYDTLTERYKNHVPLNRIFEETGDIGQALTGKGFDVRGTGIRKAKGSSREVDDIMGNITSNLISAEQRIEKNIVDNTTYDFIKNNPDLEIGKIVTNPTSTTDPLLLQLRRNGKEAYVKFEDRALADQFKGVGDQKLPEMLNFIGAFTRLYSGMSTRFNPEFFLSNKFRDIQEAMVYAGSEVNLGAKGALNVVKREVKLQNEKAIYDFMSGKDTEGARLYKEMISEGGTTGGMALSTRKDVQTNIESIEKLAQSKPRQAVNKIVESIDNLNEIFENSTRLSVYREAKAKGLSNKESARLAKESTVNFNRKGKWGSVINSLYMFSNASIQGSAKMIKAMKNPKVLGAVTAGVGSAVFITNKYNDDVDPDWREKVNKFDRASNMVVVLKGGDKNQFKYITIPVSYALKPFKVAFDGAYDLASDAKGVNTKKVLETTVSSILDSYNPVGGTSLGSALIPTIADIPAEIGLNQKWTGSKIHPDANPDLPESRQYFDSLKDTTLGRFSIALTKKLSDNNLAEISPANMAYAIEQYGGGTGKFASKTINTIDQAVGDKPLKLDEAPFISRFYKNIGGDELESFRTNSSKDAPLIKEIRQEGAKKNFDISQNVKSYVTELKSLKTKEEKAAYLKSIAKDNPEIIDKIFNQIETQSKDFTQKQYESLQIKNGERAKFIATKLKSYKTKEEKATFLKDLAERKILTNEVLDQLPEFLK